MLGGRSLSTGGAVRPEFRAPALLARELRTDMLPAPPPAFCGCILGCCACSARAGLRYTERLPVQIRNKPRSPSKLDCAGNAFPAERDLKSHNARNRPILGRPWQD